MSAPGQIATMDRDAIRAFIADVGVDQLVAIPCDHDQLPTGWPTGAKTIARWCGDDVEGAVEWAAGWNGAGANLYWSPNEPTRGLAKKALKEEIVAARFVYADIDPQRGEDQETAARTIPERLRASGLPPTTMLIHSGGGFQPLWLLDAAVPIAGDEARWTEYERHNRGVSAKLGADNCHNVDRVLRLPGTVNWPNAAKREKGRVPALARLVEVDGARRYAIGSFPTADAGSAAITEMTIAPADRVSPARLAGLVADQALFRLIIAGPSAGADRSGQVFHVAASLVRAKVDDTTIASILLDPDYRISGHCLGQPDPVRAASRAIERARAKQADLDAAFPDDAGPEVPANAEARRISVRASSLVGEIREKSTRPVVTTPWANFDAATDGLELGSLNSFVGYQGSGKSSFAAQLGAHHAEMAPTVYYLAEMSPRLLAGRVIGQRTGRAWKDVLRGGLTDAEMRAVLDPLHLYIVGRCENPIAAILETIQEARAAAPGTPMLVIDYVQLLADVGGKIDPRTATAKAVRDIQTITEQHDLVTIGLSQTSRSGSKRIKEGAENSADLADTGAETSEFERSATILGTFSYQQLDDTRYHDVILAVGKRRFGGPTKLGFRYDGLTGLWTGVDAVPKPKAKLDLQAAIVEQLTIHAARQCMGGIAPCSRTMNGAAFYARDSPHKIASRKDDVLAGLRDLVRFEQIRKAGNVYSLAEAQS